MPLGTALVKHHTQGPNIAFLIVWLVLTQLRAEIIWGANDRLGKVGVCAQNLQ